MSHLTRIETLFLKPLSIIALGAALLYLFQGAWLIAAWMGFVWFVVGVAGASLHPKLGFSELARGTPLRSGYELVSELSEAQSFSLGKALVLTTGVCGSSGLLLARHYGFGWWAALGVSISAFLLSLVVPLAIVLLTSLEYRWPKSGGALTQAETERPDFIVTRTSPSALVYDGHDNDGLALLLERWGLSALHVRNASEAEAALRCRAFDLVILDSWDPNIRSKIDSFSQASPRLLFLDFEGQNREFLSSKGYAHVLDKPVDPDELKGLIQELLAQKLPGPLTSNASS